eukprot:m.374828 g.374828  ORF g.374828 m.374828 type:complete len:248 (+) comp16692_c0_seq15:53-796(+)
MSWFTREEVRMQLAGLGYTDVSEDTLEDFYADLVAMAETEEQQSREDVNHSVAAAASLPTRPAGPAVPPIQSDEHYSQMLTQAPVDHIVDLFEQLEQLTIEQKAKARLQQERDDEPEPSVADTYDIGTEFDLEDEPRGGLQKFTECMTDPEYTAPAYIHKRAPKKKRKDDPVERGRRYREEQQRYNIPGQTRHTQLRRSVREQLRENVDPPFTRPSHRHQKNEYVVPTEKKRQALRWVVRQYTEHAH